MSLVPAKVQIAKSVDGVLTLVPAKVKKHKAIETLYNPYGYKYYAKFIYKNSGQWYTFFYDIVDKINAIEPGWYGIQGSPNTYTQYAYQYNGQWIYERVLSTGFFYELGTLEANFTIKYSDGSILYNSNNIFPVKTKILK